MSCLEDFSKIIERKNYKLLYMIFLSLYNLNKILVFLWFDMYSTASPLFLNIIAVHHNDTTLEVIFSQRETFGTESQLVLRLMSFSRLPLVIPHALLWLDLMIGFASNGSKPGYISVNLMTGRYLTKMIDFMIFGLCGSYSFCALLTDV